MKQIHKLSWALLFILAVAQIVGCKKTEKEPDVIASFTFAIDATNFKLVTFTSTSQNFQSLSWDFGDGTAAATTATATHTYAALGEFTVKLTATSPGGVTDVFASKVTIADPNAYLTMLVGDVSKTWKLIRQTSTKRYPIECGPADHSTIWWATGLNNDEIPNRSCMMDDTWTFSRAGLTMAYDAKGTYWEEGGVFAPGNICANTSDPMIGIHGEDLSAWNSGNFTFVLTPGTKPTITVNGKGAFIGYYKLGSGIEVSSTNPIVVPTSITYSIIKLVDANVDTLVVEGNYSNGPGYWRHTLVHYDNPADEPALPGPKPQAGFSFILADMTITCTNTSTNATSYLWDFGDGATSTEQNPVHTFAADGLYTITLTATNANGTSTAIQTCATSVLTLDDLIGTWKLKVADYSIFVGDGLGHSNWWACPKAFLDGSTTGTDDWSCMTDDEFIFSAGGVFEYKTNGGTRNDGFFGTPNGCWSDAEIAASHASATSGEGAAFGSGTYTYTFTPASSSASGTPIITLTTANAALHAPFLGFYKGYNGIISGVKGGENAPHDTPAVFDAPNFGSLTNTYEVMVYGTAGGKQTMVISVDITTDHLGTSAWSATLEK